MFRSYLIFNFVLLQIIGLNSQTVFSASRLHVLMDHNWKFILSDVQDANKISLDDNNWKSLNLPHDWSIEGAFKEDAPTKGEGGYLPAGTGWYRKHFKLDVNQKEQNVWIEFEGVYMNSEVWINEHYLGKHPYGYT